MINSMTGYTRLTTPTAWGQIHWELRSVNSRYLEINMRLPELLRSQELTWRDLIKTRLQRGKIDITLKIHWASVAARSFEINSALLQQLGTLCHQIKQALPIVTASIDPLTVLQWPDLLQTTDTEIPEINADIQQSLQLALNAFQESRAREGEHLRHYLIDRSCSFREYLNLIEKKTPQLITAWRAKLQAKFADYQMACDPLRLEQELVLYAQRSDFSEELARLKAHLQELDRLLESSGSAVTSNAATNKTKNKLATVTAAHGRALDFLMQEFQRETNTLGAKCTDIEISQTTVQMKVLIDQMREQIQNIE